MADFRIFPALSIETGTPLDAAAETCLKPPRIVGQGMHIPSACVWKTYDSNKMISPVVFGYMPGPHEIRWLSFSNAEQNPPALLHVKQEHLTFCEAIILVSQNILVEFVKTLLTVKR